MPELARLSVRLSAIVMLSAMISTSRADAQAATAAGGAEIWTLADCHREVLRQNRDLRAANARLDAARSMTWQARRWANPSFNARAVSDEREFSLSQEMDPWGKRAVAGRAAEAEAGVDLGQRDIIERELLAMAIGHYWNLAGSRRLVAMRTEELEAWERFLDIREAEVALGAFSIAGILLLRQETAERQMAILQARFEADSERAALNTLMARQPDEPLDVDVSLPGEVRVSAEDLFAAALRNDPAAKKARARLLATGHHIEREQRQWRPSPELGLVVREDGGQWDAGVQVAFTIPVWNRNRGGIHSAMAAREQSMAEVESAELLAVQHAYRQLLRYDTAAESLSHYETQILPSAQERLSKARQAFETGDLGARDILALKLEWMRREQEAEHLRYQRSEAASRMDLIMRPPHQEPSSDRHEKTSWTLRK